MRIVNPVDQARVAESVESVGRDLLAELPARGIPRLVIAPGMTSDANPQELDWDPLVDVTVLNAGAQPEWDGGDLNNDSVVLKITYGEVDLVTGGDCLVAGEARILSLFAPALAGVPVRIT